MFVGARIKHVTIQNLGPRAYIPETSHVKLERQRTDRTNANIPLSCRLRRSGCLGQRPYAPMRYHYPSLSSQSSGRLTRTPSLRLSLIPSSGHADFLIMQRLYPTQRSQNGLGYFRRFIAPPFCGVIFGFDPLCLITELLSARSQSNEGKTH